MLGITLIFIGRTKEKYFIEAQGEYSKRLRPFCVLEIIEIPERRTPADPSASEIGAALRAEAAEVLSRIPSGAFLIAACVEGGDKTSPELALMLESLPTQGVSKICFIVGGSFGIHESVKEKANLRLSLSRMTLPHSLARVVLLEQLYRAFSITAGLKYHK